MKLLIDMNLSPIWVSFLASKGVDAVHWSIIGAMNASDQEIMAWAAENDYVVFTHDMDFGTLLSVTQVNSPSVIQLRTKDVLPGAVGDLVILALYQSESALEAGALVTVDEGRSRLRILPIRNKDSS
ncbi:hypothetical protein GS597_05910 [Synechococcales cyanobacterium C]|uniref:DUF5615 domain-containing protein n=1 Tax=Petrachloros mirabilis ULC683 TaxID=2781853 RepID=A0A8K1ZXY4_9CYAN|nr:DUF5615 family PIN-like protein [Petrachloros mirabilis]NCJ06056.1 hypothetical protein [Petrachloros mirabilis ULC683]